MANQMEQNKGGYFVVVQTKEAGKPVLTVVPYQWVSDGFLMWPAKQANVLRKKAASQPLSFWSKIPCTVRRRYIPTFAEAEQEAADLSGQSTEASDAAPRTKKKKTQKFSKSRFDFNYLVEGSADPHAAIINSPQPPAADVLSNQNSADVGKTQELVFCQPDLNLLLQTSQSQATQQLPELIYQTVDNTSPVENFNLAIKSPLNPVQNISPHTNDLDPSPRDYVIIEETAADGNKIVEDISKLIDSACEKVIEAVVSKVGTMLAGLKSDVDVKLAAALRMQTPSLNMDDKFTFSPVSSVLGITSLEQDLADEHFATRLALYMKKIVGHTPDNCNGLNVCYSLIDYFFDRKLMLQCSWSGGSRGPEPKFAMKSCSNILNTFFEIVHSVNMTFSRNLMEHFFKQITRNSKSRCKAKGLWHPTVHRRGKKVANLLTNMVQADTNTGEQHRDDQPESSCSERDGSDLDESSSDGQVESPSFLGFA